MSGPLRLLALMEAYSITGPAKNLLEFARLARQTDIELTIATFTRASVDNLFIETVRKQGIPMEVIEERGPYDTRLPQTLRNITDRLKPHILQSHAVKSHFLVRWAGLPAEVPWIAFHHGYTWPSFKARLYNQLDRWSLPAARKVITMSAPFREQLISQGVSPERIEIIHNAIPTDWGMGTRQPEQASALRARLNIPEGRPVILIVGRLSREKDHLTLLRAVHRLQLQTDPHLIIVGDGPERPVIEETIAKLGLSQRTTLTGQQNTAEPYYGIADVAVLSSLSEGSPNALLEAMAAQVPVVATNVGGIPEIVASEKSALLVKSADVEAMSAAIRRILDDPHGLAKQLVRCSSELIRQGHNPENRMRRLVNLYHSISES